MNRQRGCISTTQTLLPSRSGTNPSHYSEWKLLSQHWPYHRRRQETRRGLSAQAHTLRRRGTCRLGRLQYMDYAVTVAFRPFLAGAGGGLCAGLRPVRGWLFWVLIRICTVTAARGRGSAGRDDGAGWGCDHHVRAAKGGRLAAPKADTAFLVSWEFFLLFFWGGH